jgi:hypothetical protein
MAIGRSYSQWSRYLASFSEDDILSTIVRCFLNGSSFIPVFNSRYKINMTDTDIWNSVRVREDCQVLWSTQFWLCFLSLTNRETHQKKTWGLTCLAWLFPVAHYSTTAWTVLCWNSQNGASLNRYTWKEVDSRSNQVHKKSLKQNNHRTVQRTCIKNFS